MFALDCEASFAFRYVGQDAAVLRLVGRELRVKPGPTVPPKSTMGMFFAFAEATTAGIVDGSMPVSARTSMFWASRLLPQVTHLVGVPCPSQ